MTFPVPSYSPSIVRVQLLGGELRLLERIPLKLPSGFTDPITRDETISGIPTSDHDETPWSADGDDRLPYDPNGLDPEGLTFDKRDSSFWICEEYGPSIVHVGADGTILSRIVPRGLGLIASGEGVREMLPRELLKRKINRGFEGIAITPDSKTLIAVMQSPISNPDRESGEASRAIRMVTLDISNSSSPRVSGMYVYLLEPGSKVGVDQDNVMVGDLAAYTANRMLVVERDTREDGRHKMIYSVDLSGATNILDRSFSRDKSLEEMTESELRGAE